MRRKQLEGLLGQIEGFSAPNILLEQYVTGVEIAAEILSFIRDAGDLDGKFVADLGAGTGSLSIGALSLGAEFVTCFEMDSNALGILRDNMENLDVESRIDCVQCDVTRSLTGFRCGYFDTVIMNPPFGTKKNQGIDMEFLKSALSISSTVYSLHKTSTRKHVLDTGKKLGAEAKVIAELRYDIPASYKFHRSQSVDIAVDFIQFKR